MTIWDLFGHKMSHMPPHHLIGVLQVISQIGICQFPNATCVAKRRLKIMLFVTLCLRLLFYENDIPGKENK
jgi:hypothetical protein